MKCDYDKYGKMTVTLESSDFHNLTSVTELRGKLIDVLYVPHAIRNDFNKTRLYEVMRPMIMNSAGGVHTRIYPDYCL